MKDGWAKYTRAFYEFLANSYGSFSRRGRKLLFFFLLLGNMNASRMPLLLVRYLPVLFYFILFYFILVLL